MSVKDKINKDSHCRSTLRGKIKPIFTFFSNKNPELKMFCISNKHVCRLAIIEVSLLYSNVKYTITQYYIVNICVKAHYVNTNVCINKNFQLTKCLSRGCLKAFSNVVLIKIILLSSSSNMGYYLPYKNIIMAFASSVRFNTVTN